MRVKICLLLIVKNEAHIIRECLETVYPYISYWVISDTGSTDDTPKIITDFFKEKAIPGELHHDEWKRFDYNRTLNFEHCERGPASKYANYMWVIDADDKPVGNFVIPDKFTADEGLLKYKSGNLEYFRPQLFKIGLDWEYICIVHELAFSRKKLKTHRETINGDYFIDSRRLGDRSLNPLKYYKDGMLILQDYNKLSEERKLLVKGKDDKRINRIELILSRYRFYMGQSFRDFGDAEYSEKWYNERAKNTSSQYDEECYQSRLECAHFEKRRNEEKRRKGEEVDDKEMETLYMKAFNAFPFVLEPYHFLVEYFNRHKVFDKAYFYATKGQEVNIIESSNLFTLKSVYDYAFYKECAYAALNVGKLHESFNIIESCLARKTVPNAEIVFMENIRNANLKQELVDSMKTFPGGLISKITLQKCKPVVFITNFINFEITTTCINSFIKCCTDYHLIAEWIVYGDAPQPLFQKMYPFIKYMVTEGIDILNVSQQKYILYCPSNFMWLYKYPYITKSMQCGSDAIYLNGAHGELSMGFDKPVFCKSTVTEDTIPTCNQFMCGVFTQENP